MTATRFLARPRLTRTGFTLIELLVVIGIIALLVGILLPTLAMARQVAQQIKCMGHVRGIGTALEIFANDHREEYPTAGALIEWDQTDPTTGKQSWMQQLTYYVAAHEAAFDGCPTYPRQTPFHYFLGTHAAYHVRGAFAPVIRSRVRYSSYHILTGDNNFEFADGDDNHGKFDADKDDYTQDTTSFIAGPNNWEPHHYGGLNLFFVDGHGAFFRNWDHSRMTLRYDEMWLWVLP